MGIATPGAGVSTGHYYPLCGRGAKAKVKAAVEVQEVQEVLEVQVPPLLVPGWSQGEAQRDEGNARRPMFAPFFPITFLRRLLDASNRFLCPLGSSKIV